MLPPPAAREACPRWGALSVEAVGKEPRRVGGEDKTGLQLSQTHRKRRRVALDWAHGEGKIAQAVLHVEPKLCLGSQALGASDPLTTPGPQLHFTWSVSAQCSKRAKLQITGWMGRFYGSEPVRKQGPEALGTGCKSA